MKVSDNAVPWVLFAVVTCALVVVLMNMDSFARSSAQGDRWKQWEADAASEHATRQVFEDRINAVQEKLDAAEAKLAACGCH